MKESIFISGTGMSGTSLMQAVLNCHSKVKIEFEQYYKKENYQTWLDMIAHYRPDPDTMWGNKCPIGKMTNHGYTEQDIIDMHTHSLIIWMRRRKSGFKQSWFARARRDPSEMQALWNRSNRLYEDIRDAVPDRIIMVQFEDLVLRPESETRRVCDFLGLDYEPGMINNGPQNMSVPVQYYKQEGFVSDKAFIK